MRIKLLGDMGPLHRGVMEICERRGDDLLSYENYEAHDLLLLAGYTRIIRPDEIRLANWGGLCFHPSLLPRHRGRDAVYWTLERGETVTGVTWFWINRGIDTGPIAAQAAVEIQPGMTRGALYYQYLVPLGLELLPFVLQQLDAGRATRVYQDESQATYEPPRPAGP